MGLFDFLKKKPVSPAAELPAAATKVNPNRIPAETIITELDRAGYFNYAADDDLSRLKKEIGRGLAEDGCLSFVVQDEPDRRVLDLRHFAMDSEDLFEDFGMVDMIETMQPFFTAIGVQIYVTDHVQDYDSKNQWVDQSMKINGKPYVIFHHFKGYGWGEAAQRFTAMINDQLSLQQSEERLYLINGGNHGRGIFLSAELFTLLRTYITDPNEQPLTTEEVCRLNGIDHYRFD